MMPVSLDFDTIRSKIKTRKRHDKMEIWDILRQKWLILQPEEWVRQNVIHALIHEKGYSKNTMAVEKEFMIHNVKKRFDLVIYDKFVRPYLLVECKAFQVTLNQDVFDQLGLYNRTIQAPFLLASNGVLTYCFEQNHDSKALTFRQQLPDPQ
ncbi:MAG: type I restriction enzyme HsdR N-terminal domain-containing protein [Saprospiraceae bacterium]